jgi:protein-tyrosine phosphatase
MPQEQRREFFNDPEKRKSLNKVRNAQPYAFTWECTDGEHGPFRVVISEKEDFSTPSPALALPTGKDASPNEARIANFLIGKTYYWKVEGLDANGQPTSSQTARFHTDPLAPRLLTIPNIENARDLGGRTGLDGRHIRQGLIYRSAGLNANSPDFDWDRTKWKKERIEDFRIGDTKLSPEGVAYINDVLRWKTDLDLRGPGEVATMKESPAGPAVKWVHNSSLSYAKIFGQDGNCTGEGPEAMARNFRLFCDRANYPIEFHCIAGADRTGALAYILNGVLGVKADDLEKDWEITANSYFKYEKMFNDLSGGFEKFGEPGDPLHKKIEAYLQKIGITPEEIASFRAIMLE